MLKAAVATVLAALALAACGTSGPKIPAQAMKDCTDTAPRPVCTCAFQKMQAAGLSPDGYAREIADTTAIADKRILNAAAACLGS